MRARTLRTVIVGGGGISEIWIFFQAFQFIMTPQFMIFEKFILTISKTVQILINSCSMMEICVPGVSRIKGVW